jgi:hypothetical protein
MLRSPSKSLRKLAQEKDIRLATEHKVAREKLNLFPYKVTAVQELKPADHEKRTAYLRKTKSPTPGFKKMALLRTQITTL